MLEVKVLSNYRELYSSGHETEKSPFSDMMLHIEEAVAKVKECPYVLGLASTIGWEERAIEYVKEGIAPSSNLCLVLIDLRDGTMHYNSSDQRLPQFLPYLVK